jgi:hypothetical protein
MISPEMRAQIRLFDAISMPSIGRSAPSPVNWTYILTRSVHAIEIAGVASQPVRPSMGDPISVSSATRWTNIADDGPHAFARWPATAATASAW